jgi:hypothetical protein
MFRPLRSQGTDVWLREAHSLEDPQIDWTVFRINNLVRAFSLKSAILTCSDYQCPESHGLRDSKNAYLLSHSPLDRGKYLEGYFRGAAKVLDWDMSVILLEVLYFASLVSPGQAYQVLPIAGPLVPI